ncbi:Uncharacterised protein [Serratia marcescens]|nr:Uncharacterised protein [Serratia marcescens]CUZ99850.1 Uncharacterised protein [Serratia marcescens]CVA26879.1 Uncharacterised protein [Serratia marcescens]CVA67280.1 Uncharacterised protein [Serratia marcescens]CVA79107.1 Uncharacterised protein [Serratia marcescens]
MRLAAVASSDWRSLHSGLHGARDRRDPRRPWGTVGRRPAVPQCGGAGAPGSQRGGARKLLPRHAGGYQRAGAAVRPERRARRRAANRLPLPGALFGAEPAVAATGAAAGRQPGQPVPPGLGAGAGERQRARRGRVRHRIAGASAGRRRRGTGIGVVYQHVAAASGHRSARRGDGGKRGTRAAERATGA